MTAGLSSSFDPAEVTLLLTDLSHLALERPLAEREARSQGGGHYAEVLPIEYAPGPAYLDLFDRLLAQQARPVAEHVGALTELVLATRSPRPVLVSLARAGTPVGVLMRRWAAGARGLELPHYSLSIVRGRGIDTVALDHVLARHAAADVVFVDGWSGKGAIAIELAEALAGTGVDPELAVVADPGGVSALHGTRADLLLPSACLNATVCGLVSRTVLNRDVLTPGQFHGAKVYRELAAADRTDDFLDSVSDCFPTVRAAVDRRLAGLLGADRTPTWAGAETVRRVQAEHGLPSWHLVKPSVGETTRVLLRRQPERVLVRPDRRAELAHVLALAAERAVPVADYPDMTYAAIGLIAPVAGDG